jgi:acyl-CoA synthetase (AMP-forming)/AMP-acid ligase II
MLQEPNKLINDVTVAGVSGGRTEDERVPRAWIVLSEAGKRQGADVTIKILEAYIKKNLSRYKHLRGGIEVIDSIPKSPAGKVRFLTCSSFLR